MALLEDALDLPSDEQEAFIASRTDLDEDVREFALALLKSDDENRVAINTGGAGNSLRNDEAEIEPPDLPGYRIIRELGRGGMGAVFLAERTTRDFEHRVAIKVIKPGVLLDTLVDRFRRERQILAKLNHPNIGHLYDGGETADGLPYIVMEYIQGETLREWLRQKPDLKRRLDLFLQVAEAVAFAHQNLVIHRDLTPNNVLVTQDDQAKLIDFGIARPQVEDNEDVANSKFTGLSLTPGFAAPERKSGVVSNTLADIFSLGRLFALMTDDAEDRELKAIAAKAAEEDADQRYGSVNEMVDEILNFRRGMPVVTFSDTSGYRVRKFVGREKTLVGAVAAILLAILIGLVATGWAYQRAEASRIEAERRFDELRELAKFQLFDLYDAMDNVVGNTEARVALAARAQNYLVILAESRSEDRQLQLDTADGFVRLARIQGIPAHPNFGEPDLAAANLDRAQQLYRPLAEKGVLGAQTGLARLEAYRALLLAHGESKVDEAWQAIERGRNMLAGVPATARGEEYYEASRILHGAALEWADLERDSELMSSEIAAVEREIRQWPEAMHGGYVESFEKARLVYYRAIVVGNEDTEEAYRKSVQLYLDANDVFGAIEAEYPNDPMTLYWRAWNAYYGYGTAAALEDDAVTARLLAQARESVERLLLVEEADNSLHTLDGNLREAQAQFFSNLGRSEEAISLMQGVMDIRLGRLARSDSLNNKRDVAFGHAIFGAIQRKAGHRAEACSNWQASEDLMAELEAHDALQGFVADLRPGINANLKRCAQGLPVSSFTSLDN